MLKIHSLEDQEKKKTRNKRAPCQAFKCVSHYSILLIYIVFFSPACYFKPNLS